MGVLNVVIPDELERRLRKHLPHKRGALSNFIAEAIEEKLSREEGEDVHDTA